MLKYLTLENFRNHKCFETPLGMSNVFLGRNGVGKTNILEAVGLLSSCRSFREDDRKNLIMHDKDFSRIVADDLEVILCRSPKLSIRMLERGAGRRAIDFIGLLPSVVFSPETISIITGTPGDKRRFLDIMISQVDREYLRALINYNKIRRQRNNLLQIIARGEADEDELLFWDEEIVSFGNLITEKRITAVSHLNKEINGIYLQISGDGKSEFQIYYEKNWEDDLSKKIIQFRSREIAAGRSLLGPHRDNIISRLDNHDMQNFASRGEVRSAILAIKISELKFIEKMNKESSVSKAKHEPILLLDDVFSEFDDAHREHMVKLFLKYQTIITTAEEGSLPKELLKNAKVIKIGE